MLRLFPNAVAAGAGLLHGVAAQNDREAEPPRMNPDGSLIENKWPLSLGVEVLALVGGAVGDMMRISPDLSEPLVHGGAFALGSRAGAAASRSMGSSGYVAGYYSPRAVPFRGDGHAVAAPALVRSEDRISVLG